MPAYNFFSDFNNHDNDRFSSIDRLPDFRSDVEKSNTPLAAHNYSSADLALAERYAEESINIGGAWTTLFIKLPYLGGETDDVWDEDPDPLYRQGINIKAYFKVNPLNLELTKWGIDAPLKVTFVYPRAVLAKKVGMDRLLTVGDVIEAPYNAPKMKGKARFRVLNAYDSGMYKYRWLYYTAVCELLTGDKPLQVVLGESK